MRDMKTVAAVLAAMLASSLAVAQTNVEWPAYANDGGGTHYSPLRSITKANVNTLTVAWTYHTGALSPESALNRKAAFEATPLMVGGTLYVITPFNKVIALDPETGTERWTYDPQVDRSVNYSEVTSRGVAMWKRARIFFGTLDGRLICLDAKAGKPCSDFGEGGAIALNRDSNPPEAGEHEVTSPPAIIGNLVIVGSAIGDNGRVDMGRGLVRAYDVHTGKQRWSFNTLLPLGDNNSSGAANAWAVISVDPARKMVFVPTSSPSPDYFGGLRPGDDHYANSVVALDATTGNVVWHFQVVHHDLWDYDVASQPVLVMFKSTPAVAVTTKMGHLFILDRRNGKPLLPVDEREVPKSDIPEERASATQPFPRNPALVPMRLRAEDAFGTNDAEREACRAKIASLRNEGIFTPPTAGAGTLVFPGNVGGVAWGGAAYDPARKLLIVPTNRLGFAARLIPRADLSAEYTKAKDNRLRGEFGSQRGAPYAMYREPLMSPNGVPCNPPPWGALSAVDIDTGAIKWEVPLGSKGMLALGGPLVTASGLTFISATVFDDTFRAFDTTTGRLVWETKLPVGAQSTPMTYRYKGKQYIVLAAGGHAKVGTTMGDHLVAWRLK